MEKEVLGFYLRSHPLAEYEKQLSAYASHSTDELSKLPDRSEVILGGMVSSIKFAHTKNARPDAPTKYVNFDLEDMQGSIRCMLWPTGFAEMGDLVQADVILCIRGAVDRRGGGDAFVRRRPRRQHGLGCNPSRGWALCRDRRDR